MIGGQTLRRTLPVNLEGDALRDAGVGVLHRLRPADGWLALVLLATNLCVVVLAVEQADWAPTPSLVGILLLGMLTAFVFHRIAVYWFLAILPGLILGGLTVVWQVSGYTFDGETLGGVGALWNRLTLWMEAAQEQSINIDKVPFAFGLVSAAWLTGYLGAWVFLRHRNFWGVFALGGLGLFSNLTFLPPNTTLHLSLYLFTALLLVARVQAVRRQSHWDRRGIRYDEGLRALSLSDSFFLALAVIVIAVILPVGGTWSAATRAYESLRTPLVSLEDDFNRLFAGLPARREIGFRVWDDVMPFAGTINPAPDHTLLVDSPIPMHWKARTYDTYTGKGWISEHTEFQPLDHTPQFSRPAPPDGRLSVTYAITPLYSSEIMFAGPRVTQVDQEVEIETPAAAIYRMDLSLDDPLPDHPQALAESARAISARAGANQLISEAELTAMLPPHFRINEIEREGGRIASLTVEEALPDPADVLALRHPDGVFASHNPYVITSSVPVVDPEKLQAAGTAYPVHIYHRYTQLPPDLPGRIGGLAHEITVNAETPYEKAVLIERNLQRLEYNLEIDAPPFDADGVDHFLFNQKQGYSEYFASAMVVLLRTVKVPARLAVGYTSGEETEVPGIYAVRDSNSHGWVEVYFPGYSWVPFEPTPGQTLPDIMISGEGESLESDRDFFAEFDVDCVDDFIDECLEYVEPFLGPGSEGSGPTAQGGTPRWVWVLVALGGLSAALVATWWAFRRYMFAAYEPEEVYGRVQALAAVGGLGGATPKTPYQFGERLKSLLPLHHERLDLIVDTYVRARYGARRLSSEQTRELADAWLNLRFPLLITAIGHRIYPRIET